jgi:hypothetical protein
MNWIMKFYRENINGIIFTLIFHIIVFLLLYISQFKVKNQFSEPEIIIDFSIIEEEPVQQELENNEQSEYPQSRTTNVASNRSATKQDQSIDEQYQKELEDAQRLVKDVSRQLSKEIPTVNDLRMPDAAEADPMKIKDKMYTGESNIQYFLENRFHTKLPIPVYLAQGGGKVRVNIKVDRAGKVISADPVVEPQLSEQVLSYAKTAALRSTFNPDNNAPQPQSGFIVYHFIPQR